MMIASVLRRSLYEISQDLRQRSVVALVLVLMMLGLGVVVQLPAPLSSEQNFYSSIYYFESSSVHFEFYAFDQLGHPINGVPFSETITSQTNSTPLAKIGGETNASGLLVLSATLPPAQYNVQLRAGPQGTQDNFFASKGGDFGVTIYPSPPGVVNPLGSPIVDPIVIGSFYSQSPGLNVFFPGPNGTAPPDYQVYFTTIQVASGAPIVPIPESSMRFLGVLDSPHEVFPISISLNSNESSGVNIQLEIFSMYGKLLSLDANTSVASLPSTTRSSAGVAALSYGSAQLILFVPLIALLLAFAVYARPRITGTLESVLVLPVTPMGLAVSRYLAVMMALAIGLVLNIALIDFLSWHLTGQMVGLPFAVEVWVGLFVPAEAFAGMVFLLSQASRSTVWVLGGWMALYGLFSTFWYLILDVIGNTFGFTAGEGFGMVRFLYEATFANPMWFLYLMSDYLSGSLSGAGAGSVSPSTYGISLITVVLDGTGWVILPLLGFLLLVRRRR